MEFKRLSDVEVVAEPAESANVLIEENGVIKKAPKTAVGGGLSIVYNSSEYDDNIGGHVILYASENLYEIVQNAMTLYQIPNIMSYNVTTEDTLVNVEAACLKRIQRRYDDDYIFLDFGSYGANIYSDGQVQVYYND